MRKWTSGVDNVSFPCVVKRCTAGGRAAGVSAVPLSTRCVITEGVSVLQEDAQEFLQYLVERAHSELLALRALHGLGDADKDGES